MNLTRKRVLVTGGSRFLGSYLCDRLLRERCRHAVEPRATGFAAQFSKRPTSDSSLR
jgi:nucleoside-diphosphate-sugar epimerase